MPANTQPVFPLTPLVGFTSLSTANNVYNGTGTVGTVFTAGSNGGRADFVRCRPLGTNVASVLRVFVNNGSTNATATNNSLVAEVALPATTASAAAETGTEITLPLGMTLPAGYKLNVVIGTAVSAGWQVTCFGGDY